MVMRAGAPSWWTDISLAHGKVLEQIRFDDACVRDLADGLGMSHQVATQLVDHLDRAGRLAELFGPAPHGGGVDRSDGM